MKYFFTLFAFLALPLTALAHVKWFVSEDAPAMRVYQLTDGPVITWIIVSLVIIAAGILIEKYGPRQPRPIAEFLHHSERNALTIFSIVTGIAMLLSSYLGYIFAPNLILEGTLRTILLGSQAIIGALLVLGIFVRIAGLALLALYFFAVWHFGALHMADALIVVGISLFLLITGRPSWRITKSKAIDRLTRNYHSYAIPVIRVFTGINLVVLGFTEKILHPELGMAFLAEHHWNFMQMLGFASYSDYWFVLSAGVVETLLGVVLVLGIVTRINTLVLATFFVATLILLGPVEVIGHLMHFAIVGLLLVFGAGNKWRLVKQRPALS